MTSTRRFAAFLFALIAAGFSPHAQAALPVTAISGSTVIDVSHKGAQAHDIRDAVVLMQDGRILAVGTRTTLKIPAGAVVVDARGKFLIPGLVDGFAGIRNQQEADTFLLEGITTVVATGDDRRGTLYLAADPGPHVYALDSVGSTDDWSLLRADPAWRDRLADGAQGHELSPAETSDQIAEIARRGTKGLWIGHNITQANAALIIAKAKSLHLATYGEFVATPYAAGIDEDVDCLLHMTRFELGLASDAAIAAAAADPEGVPAQKAYAEVDPIQPSDPRVANYGDSIAAHGVALMPTFSLYYLALPGHRNLWREKASKLLDPRTLQLTADPDTGELPSKSSEGRKQYEAFAAHYWALDKALIARHPIMLAASGSDWAGTLPGVSMHTELELLVRAGLSPREALAAATGNYAEQFGWTELGAIAAGRRADIVILDADPTRDIANADRIDSVYLAGSKVDTKVMEANK